MAENRSKHKINIGTKPILKWAGGKTQMLKDLIPRIPSHYGKYIEPFVGGGALFFALMPEDSIIADRNPELINMYREVANHVDEIIALLKKFKNTKEDYYAIRDMDWTQMTPVKAAARMIYLNKTCYNGLYRVNKKGGFNVPFGRYKSPNICDEDTLYAASAVLKRAKIICGDYIDVLKRYAKKGDFVFLDPPYLPVSDHSDFKRYTKEQFHEEDHIKLAKEIERLKNLGCNVILTNSNHPIVHELYASYPFEVVQTKRYISCNGNKRLGEDVIVSTYSNLDTQSMLCNDRVQLYPKTRFMGSKSKLLSEIWSIASQFEFDSVVDLFSGSGIVGYMFKTQGKTVISNDYMNMSTTFAKAMIENNQVTLSLEDAKKLLIPQDGMDSFVSDTFQGLYFSDEDNRCIDTIRYHISFIKDPYEKAIAMSALIRACMKKRARGIFTYTGDRYNDGRKDLQKTMEQQFLEAVLVINDAVFDNHKYNQALNGNAMDLNVDHVDLVYIDPPYYSPLSDNEYVRRYHFVEGLARDWQGVEIQWHTTTKKFKSYPTPFSTKDGALNAFDQLFEKFSDSILIISYSSNSLPTKENLMALLGKYKKHVKVVPIDYMYSFGNQKTAKVNRNKVQEYLFVAY